MKKQLTKRHMTKFDYNIRLFSIITGIAFVAALAFITPLIDSVNASLNRTNDQIKIQMLENNNTNCVIDSFCISCTAGHHFQRCVLRRSLQNSSIQKQGFVFLSNAKYLLCQKEIPHLYSIWRIRWSEIFRSAQYDIKE